MEEDWNKAFKRFEQYANKFNLLDDIKASCIQLVFRDDAETFFLKKLEPYHHDYQTMIQLLNDRYNSPQRKRSMLDEISKLTFAEFKSSEKTESVALSALARRIERIVPQLDPPHNDEKAKREVLRSALLETPWAQTTIYNLMHSSSDSKTYKQFYDELTAAEHQHRIFSVTKPSKHVPTTHTKTTTTTPSISKLGSAEASIWYQGQARYGRDRNAFKRGTISSSSRSLNCYNCGKQGHGVSNCRAPKDEVRIVKARIRYLLTGKIPEKQVIIPKALLGEHAAHINFLSDELCAYFTRDDFAPAISGGVEQKELEYLVTVVETESEPDEPAQIELTPEHEDTTADLDTKVVCHILSDAKRNTQTPHPDEFSILYGPSEQYHEEKFMDRMFAKHDAILEHRERLIYTPSHNHSKASNSTPKMNLAHSKSNMNPAPRTNNVTILPTTVAQFHTLVANRFHGACLDIGAQRTCIGLPQAKALMKRQGTRLKLKPSPYVFKFGDVRHKSLGQVNICIPTPNYTFIEVNADVVPADVPLLIGIDTLDKYQLVADNVKNVLEGRQE